jgi:hypothetical protein
MENKEQLEALQEIRQMMKQSSRFLSLSGLSGVFAGVYALIGAWLVWMIMSDESVDVPMTYEVTVLFISTVSVLVLGLSVLTALIFSVRKARRSGQKIFDHTSKRLLLSLFIPLLAGGLLCVAILFKQGHAEMIVPVMLCFYGMALVNGSKYTFRDIYYLGCLEIVLGVLSAFFLEQGLLFWALGFGFLHIIYGTWMWYKYERNT